MQKNLPQGYELTLVYDQSTFISDAIAEVKSAAFEGGLLAMLVIYLFLRNVWTTLVISISIPVSVITTFNLMHSQDISLNIMSLGGIALAIGMLVDNAIVVLENISRYREQGYSPMEAAKKRRERSIHGDYCVDFNHSCSFLPLVFVEGVAGQLFKDQALTVTYALLASLLVALTLIPAMAARERNFIEVNVTNEEIDTTPKVQTKFRKVLGYIGLFFKMIWRGLAWVISIILTAFTLIWRGIAKVLSVLLNPLLNLVQKMLRALESLYKGALTFA